MNHFWKRLSAGGSVDRCGWLQDKFGVSWQIVPSALPAMLGDPDAARAARVMQAMLAMVKLDLRRLRQAYGRN